VTLVPALLALAFLVLPPVGPVTPDVATHLRLAPGERVRAAVKAVEIRAVEVRAHPSGRS
jgi:hypothetical protein